MNTTDKIESLVHQLVGDISRLPGVVLDQGGEQQLAQLLLDAFEQVGEAALDARSDTGYLLQAHCG
jgi:hypothetical protein